MTDISAHLSESIRAGCSTLESLQELSGPMGRAVDAVVGAMVNTEILAQANSFGMRIHEIKVSHYPRRAGKPSGANLKVIVKAFRELFRLWGQLRNVTHEQPGLFRTDTLDAPVLSRNGRYDLAASRMPKMGHPVRVESPAKSKVSNECYAD